MKTSVHSADVQRAHLTRALLIYEDHHTAFVTVHDAGISRKGVPEIGAGVPASRSALATLAQKLIAASAISGFVPAELLYMSPRVLAWWRPASKARVFFKPRDDAEKGEAKLGTRNAITPQPGLVFAVTAAHWFVWATDLVSRPTEKTELFRAPYFNVWKSGEICTGNVKLPERLDPGVLAGYEAAFFGSNFTHPNDPQGLTRYTGGVWALWAALLDGKHEAFPARALTSTKKTLDAMVKTLEERHGR